MTDRQTDGHRARAYYVKEFTRLCLRRHFYTGFEEARTLHDPGADPEVVDRGRIKTPGAEAPKAPRA